MIRHWICKECGYEWTEDTERRAAKVESVFDEPEYCVCCRSYKAAPKMSGVTSTLRYVDTVIELQAKMNALYRMIEPIKRAFDEIGEIRAKLHDEFSFLTTDDNWDDMVSSSTFYEIGYGDVETLKNAAERRIEEW